LVSTVHANWLKKSSQRKAPAVTTNTKPSYQPLQSASRYVLAHLVPRPGLDYSDSPRNTELRRTIYALLFLSREGPWAERSCARPAVGDDLQHKVPPPPMNYSFTAVRRPVSDRPGGHGSDLMLYIACCVYQRYLRVSCRLEWRKNDMHLIPLFLDETKSDYTVGYTVIHKASECDSRLCKHIPFEVWHI
jgi:hypothetical protein